MNNNSIEIECKVFAVQIVNLYKELTEKKKEYVMSKQVLRSGTSIGANIYEAIYAESLLDFIHKRSISLKEASETQYWLELLHETGYLTDNEFEIIIKDCRNLLKKLISIIKTCKEKYAKEQYEKKKH